MNPAIRIATPADASAIQEIYAPYVKDTAITFDEIPPDVAEMRERMAQVQKQYPWLVFERDGKVVGYAYSCQHRTRESYRWSVDVGVYVRQGYARLGIGRQLYEELLPMTAALGYANAFAGITLPNDSSVGLHEALGFKPIGVYTKVGYKLGAWHDVGWWQLAFQYPPNPAEPRTFRP